MREPLVELLVEVPGLPVQVGRFRRVGIFDLALEEPLKWKAQTEGRSTEVWFGPLDKAWRLPGSIRIPAWEKGATVTLETMDLEWEELLQEMSNQAARGVRLNYTFHRV